MAAACVSLIVPSAAGADRVTPKSASGFRDSVGVVTHAVYYDTAYGDWSKVVARLRELGVTHVRDGLYANESPEWKDWTERYYRAVDLAAFNGIRFDFGVGQPGARIGTLDQLLNVAAGRLRHAVEAFEAPNEFDKYVGGRRWPERLADYSRKLYRKVNAHPTLRSVPVVGPSFATVGGPGRLGNQRAWMDVGNVHPYTGGRSPDPFHLRTELVRASAVSGNKPVWATEAGFHNALRARSGQPPVSESAAAVYHLRTFLEHYRNGIERTYAYELVDEKPEPGLRDPEQHFGLLRHDMSRKPAFTALKNLLTAVGSGDGRVPAPSPADRRERRGRRAPPGATASGRHLPGGAVAARELVGHRPPPPSPRGSPAPAGQGSRRRPGGRDRSGPVAAEPSAADAEGLREPRARRAPAAPRGHPEGRGGAPLGSAAPDLLLDGRETASGHPPGVPMGGAAAGDARSPDRTRHIATAAWPAERHRAARVTGAGPDRNLGHHGAGLLGAGHQGELEQVAVAGRLLGQQGREGLAPEAGETARGVAHLRARSATACSPRRSGEGGQPTAVRSCGSAPST